MRKIRQTKLVLVAAKEDVLNNLRDALANTNLALLHAQTKHEAVALLAEPESKIDLAIIDLELPDLGGWDLIEQITWLPQKSVKIIATTSSVCSEPFLGKAMELGVYAIVPAGLPPVGWRKTVEEVLAKTETVH
jgi:CheY-like chemotaxis protein